MIGDKETLAGGPYVNLAWPRTCDLMWLDKARRKPEGSWTEEKSHPLATVQRCFKHFVNNVI